MNFCFLLLIFHSFSSHSGFRRFLRFRHLNYTHGFMHLTLIHPHYKNHWNPGYFRTLTVNAVQHLPEHLPFALEYQQFPGTASFHTCLSWWLDLTIAQSRECFSREPKPRRGPNGVMWAFALHHPCCHLGAQPHKLIWPWTGSSWDQSFHMLVWPKSKILRDLLLALFDILISFLTSIALFLADT